MTIQEIAREIITASTLHAQASFLTGLHNPGDPKRDEAFQQMQHAEEKLIDALEDYKQQIILDIRYQKQ